MPRATAAAGQYLMYLHFVKAFISYFLKFFVLITRYILRLSAQSGDVTNKRMYFQDRHIHVEKQMQIAEKRVEIPVNKILRVKAVQLFITDL